jgi:hypothetical protein
MRLGVALCALVGLGPSLPLRAQPAPLRYGLRAEVAAEYDSNPGRVEVIDGQPTGRSMEIVGSPVGRLALSGDLFATVGTRQTLSLAASAAGKYFVRPEARAEDVVVAEASGAWNVRAGARTSVGLLGAYSEAFQRQSIEARDYQSVAPALRLEQGMGEGGALDVGVGYRWFTWKPQADLDFVGPSAFATFRHFSPGEVGAADWEWSGGATAELRNFTGIRCTENACPGTAPAGPRRDQFFTASLQVTRTSGFLLGGGLAAHGNLSNSFGERLLRGLLNVRAVVLLPADLSLSGRAELVLARYPDGLPLVRNVATGTTDVNLEGEGRSTVRVELVRSLGKHLDGGLRYTLYTNELGATPVHYFRQTAMLFIAALAE